MTMPEMLLDLLDHGCDGEPRWIALDVRDAQGASSLVRLISVEAERRGYVPLAVERLEAFSRGVPEEMQHRTFALLQTHDATIPADTSALQLAAALNARPHLLVTIAVGRGNGAQPIVREARTVYAAAPQARHSRWSPEAERYLTRARQGFALARQGRHAAAVRMLREAAAALMRRREAAAGGAAMVLLGRVLLERGRAEEAEAAFSEAVTRLDPVDPAEGGAARVWLALARIDGSRLTDAEGLLRATRLTGALPQGWPRRWADAALARCLLWQNRIGEAAQLIEAAYEVEDAADPLHAVFVLATTVRVRLAGGHLFEAGRCARAALVQAGRTGDPMLSLVAGLAHLRVLAATGDDTLAEPHKAALAAIARTHHLPLLALRLRLVWLDLLRRAGRARDAASELRACLRLERAAPELLKRHLRTVADDRSLQVTAAANDDRGAFAVALLRLVQNEEDDASAIQKALNYACTELRAGRVELQSSAGGALTAIASAGTGLASRFGQRALEAGITIGPEQRDGVWQAATVVRAGPRVLAVLTCRWPLGREPLSGACALLELTATVVAPRADVLLTSRAQVARAAAAIPELIGDSEAIAEVRKAIARAALAPFAVLLEGESGAGKELVARAIHHLSPRRDRRFCDVNCAALPEDLVEAELFGHAKGAFTGALIERKGLFEDASGGTLFLDELPDLSLRSQAKLLRVVQQNEVRRLGESFTRRVDVRLIAATNRSMADEVAAGRFRQDLLYRLDVLRITIPPLRDRPSDIPLLAQHFWQAAAQRAGTRAVLTHQLLSELTRYHWPGNVRELQNVIAALAVAAPARGLVRPALLPPAITGSLAVASGRLVEARRQFERRFIEVALARAAGSRTKAAVQLGVSRQGLLKLMARVGLTAGRPSAAGRAAGSDR